MLTIVLKFWKFWCNAYTGLCWEYLWSSSLDQQIQNFSQITLWKHFKKVKCYKSLATHSFESHSSIASFRLESWGRKYFIFSRTGYEILIFTWETWHEFMSPRCLYISFKINNIRQSFSSYSFGGCVSKFMWFNTWHASKVMLEILQARL